VVREKELINGWKNFLFVPIKNVIDFEVYLDGPYPAIPSELPSYVFLREDVKEEFHSRFTHMLESFLFFEVFFTLRIPRFK
jgi:hypothetical protein